MSLSPQNSDLVGIINTLERKVKELEFLVSRQNFDTGTGIPGPTGSQGLTGPAGPTGPQGTAATINVGTVTTVASGGSASVVNAGSTTNAIFNFSIPRGDVGAVGPAGTIAIGTVTTTASGTNASITNAGTSTAAVLNFTIPKGDKGDAGTNSNRILNGTGPPNFSIGNDEDFYLDKTAGLMYGPKTAGNWPTSTFISTPGPAGPAGSPSVTDARLFYLY